MAITPAPSAPRASFLALATNAMADATRALSTAEMYGRPRYARPRYRGPRYASGELLPLADSGARLCLGVSRRLRNQEGHDECRHRQKDRPCDQSGTSGCEPSAKRRTGLQQSAHAARAPPEFSASVRGRIATAGSTATDGSQTCGGTLSLLAVERPREPEIQTSQESSRGTKRSRGSRGREVQRSRDRRRGREVQRSPEVERSRDPE